MQTCRQFWAKPSSLTLCLNPCTSVSALPGSGLCPLSECWQGCVVSNPTWQVVASQKQQSQHLTAVFASTSKIYLSAVFFLPLNKECFFSFHSLCGKIFHMTWKWRHALLQLAEISWWPRPFCSAVKMMMEAEGVQSFTLNIVTILMTPSRALSVNHFYPQNTKWKCTSVWNETVRHTQNVFSYF